MAAGVGGWHCPVADPPVPLDASRVILLGDASVWEPAGGSAARSRWLHLRLLFCRAVWSVVCRRKTAGTPVSSAAVVRLAAAWIARAVRLDWLRVSAALPGAAALPTWCVIEERFRLTQDQF